MGTKTCDSCKHYCWYDDYCRKWDCTIDSREVHNCFEPIAEVIAEVTYKHN